MGCSEWGDALCGDELEGERLGREGLCYARKGRAQELLVGVLLPFPEFQGTHLVTLDLGDSSIAT